MLSTPVAAAEQRTFVRVDLAYSLCGPYGRVSPNTQSKAWFFDVPASRDRDDAWADLLHRLFYDANVRLGRAEPNDLNYLNLESFTCAPVDVSALLEAGGSTWESMPWFESGRDVVWEGTPCYFVDEDGQYDLLGAGDFTELLMNRLLRSGRIDETTFVSFFDRLSALAGKEPRGRMYYDGREARFANLVGVRPAQYCKRPPGSKPVKSGPVDRVLVGR